MWRQIKLSWEPCCCYPPTKPNSKMVFAPNPLSLSLPEPAFESWLRDSGYLEVLDQRTTDLHHHHSSSSSAAAAKSSDSTSTAPRSFNGVLLLSHLCNRIWTLLSLLTFNPFAKVAAGDFSGDTPSWTVAFFGSVESYSFPSSPVQAKLRVQENLKRFARNYASLLVLFFACCLYQLPISLCGLISCLVLWDAFKFGGDKWGLDRYPVIRQTLIHVAQCVTAIILFVSNVQLAVLCAIGVSYAVMILHASFRKLNLAKQTSVKGGYRRDGRR